MQKYLKTKELHFGSKTLKMPSEALSYGIGLFGIALLSGWVPEYAKTYFADFAFKNQNFGSTALATLISTVFLVAGFVGAAMEIIIGFLVDKTKSKRGKIHPWLLYGCVPLGIISMLVFVAPKTSNFVVATIWMFAIYCAYVMLLVCVESPGNCFGAVCTPNPDERSDAISIAGIMRSIGQSGGMVVLIVVGLVMKAIMGNEGFKAAEGRGLDLQISTAVCVIGFILFLVIMLRNTRERVPYTTEKVNLGQSLKFVFTNKNLLMVSLAKLAGFGRGVYGAASLYIAIYLLGDKGLKLCASSPRWESARRSVCSLLKSSSNHRHKEHFYRLQCLRCSLVPAAIRRFNDNRIQEGAYYPLPYHQFPCRTSERKHQPHAECHDCRLC